MGGAQMSTTSLSIGQSSNGVDHTVRPALASDAPDIARIQYAALTGLIPNANLPSEEQIAEQWQATLNTRPPQGCATLVAIHGTSVAGFALAVPGDPIPEIPGKRAQILAGTEIAALEIDANFHRSGHASRLLSAVKDTVGVNNLRIWVADTDEARQRFVQSAGFAPAGVRRHLKTGKETRIEHLWWAEL